MVISYEMTTSVRFCLSYAPLKLDFYRLKNGQWAIFQEENALFARRLSITLRVRAKVLLHVWSYDFYDTTLSTEYQRRHMITCFLAESTKLRHFRVSDLKILFRELSKAYQTTSHTFISEDFSLKILIYVLSMSFYFLPLYKISRHASRSVRK